MWRLDFGIVMLLIILAMIYFNPKEKRSGERNLGHVSVCLA